VCIDKEIEVRVYNRAEILRQGKHPSETVKLVHQRKVALIGFIRKFFKNFFHA
jgi:hypothetical protein